jgi:hypothetical protein
MKGTLPLQNLAGCMAFLIELRGGASSGIGKLRKLIGALVRDFGVSSQAEDARLVDVARDNPFLNSVQLKRNTSFPGCPRTVRNRKTEAGLRTRSAAVNPCFLQQTMDRYECMDLETRYNADYVKESARSGRVSVAVWGWISSRGIGLLHRIDGRLDESQYLHILRDIMVPSV